MDIMTLEASPLMFFLISYSWKKQYGGSTNCKTGATLSPLKLEFLIMYGNKFQNEFFLRM
jgi:hypothetical protein